MAYKTILVHLDAGARSGERLELAAGLAAAHGAHLVGLFALENPRLPSAALAEGVVAPIVAELDRRREAMVRAAQFKLEDSARRAGIAFEWRHERRDPLAGTLLSARYADLVVIGQPDPRAGELEVMQPWFAPEVVLGAGRPVLVVPYAGKFAFTGSRVLVAWDAGREATRALTDALPILARADHVEVAMFDAGKASPRHGEVPGADVATWVARHGPKVNVTRPGAAGVDVGNALLSHAADSNADLIVMGAYGHPRVRQMVLGGVTSTILASMTMPVLMSH